MLRRLPLAWLICMFLAAACPANAAQTPPNVLFIVIDDLRPQLGAYGYPEMKTPNMDRLADGGVRFNQQFVAVPTCGASRYSMLTGYRPSKPLDLSNEAFRQMREPENRTQQPESMVEAFRRDGYYTVGIGKISHYPDGRAYGYDRPMTDNIEMPHSWDEMGLPYGKWEHGWDAFFAYADGSSRTDRLQANQPAPPTESAEVEDAGYPDGLTAQAAIDKLGELKERDEPFFLAVGFFKPHLPFNAPQRYWDLYPPDEVRLSPAPQIPVGVHPRVALHSSGEMMRYTHPANWREDEEYRRHLRRGYMASVSYVDAQVGRVLDALEEQGLAENTIVVLWGDHGWHLGDLTIWGKHTLFDWSLRSPLIIRVPGSQQAGGAADGIVEAVDIYPTLADLCDVPVPEDLSGESLRPMLEDPSRHVKPAAFGYWQHGGVTMRTQRYRLTRYKLPDTGELVYELYDLKKDPFETRNIAPEHPQLVEGLAAELEAARVTFRD